MAAETTPEGSSGASKPGNPDGQPVASPLKAGGKNVELDSMDQKLPLVEDVMQLAKLGEIGPIEKLFEDGKADANFRDKEGTTPLHWAALHNHFGLCKYLIEKGADVNARGGESMATPTIWAAHKRNTYVVHLLLQHGADPLLADVAGYNALHLATFDGEIMLILVLLHTNIPIDVPDLQGHTSLMWAAYKGLPACVDLFLRWGASVNATDEKGFTALHWSLVTRNQACIQKLLEYGSDRFATTADGKTPTVVAADMDSERAWHRALAECGYDPSGNVKQFPLPIGSLVRNRNFLNRFFFLLPFVLLYLVFWILSSVMVYAAVPIAVFVFQSLQWAASQVLLWAPSDLRHIHKTPYLAGIFAAACFWVGVRWITTVLPATYSPNPFLNVFFAISFALCTYFYTLCMIEDPGYVLKLASRNQQKAVIEELISLWIFDESNFCEHCMVRRPLRSKHCKRCKRCVAKHDHHCPWVHNCVAANNHRHFFLYILSLTSGILLFLRLAFLHISYLPSPTITTCNLLPPHICALTLRDPFTLVLALFSLLQLIWVTMLLLVQSLQISRATTTYESMRGSTHHASRAAEAVFSAATAGTTGMSEAQIGPSGMGPDPAVPRITHHHPRREGCWAQWKKLLGLDTFVATATGSKTRRGRENPFSRGVVMNCRDFWCDPAPVFGRRENGAAMLGGEVVNYGRMYESPMRMRRRDGEVYHGLGGDESV